jgi:hypothetical protein
MRKSTDRKIALAIMALLVFLTLALLVVALYLFIGLSTMLFGVTLPLIAMKLHLFEHVGLLILSTLASAVCALAFIEGVTLLPLMWKSVVLSLNAEARDKENIAAVENALQTSYDTAIQAKKRPVLSKEELLGEIEQKLGRVPEACLITTRAV